MKRIAPLLFLVACGGGSGDDAPLDPDGPVTDGPEADGPEPDGPAGTFALTSTAFAEGETIPAAITCDGLNTSPQLDWIDPPAATQSFAIVFTDTSNGLIHSIIYDIPSTLTGLPPDVEKVFAPTDVPGAHQTASFNAGVRGYNGPCPPPPDAAHIYEFALYAIDVATLPNATMQTNRDMAKALIEAHDLARVTLKGNYER
jgi:hypothetical protein